MPLHPRIQRRRAIPATVTGGVGAAASGVAMLVLHWSGDAPLAPVQLLGVLTTLLSGAFMLIGRYLPRPPEE